MTTPNDYAKRTIRFTQDALGIFPSNHPVKFLRSDPPTCVSDDRKKQEEGIYNNRIEYIKQIAKIAKDSKCGNCQEYAAVAFDYLMDICPYQIEYALYMSPGDHAFVIIGRDPLTSIAAYPSTWGSSAVVVDTWASNIVPSHRYWDDMVPFTTGLERVFTGDRVHSPGIYAQYPT